jgi:thiamine biosynthesis lipoprotein ApbE
MTKHLRRRFVHLALSLAVLGWFGIGRPSRASDDFTFHHENVMGTSLELRVRADDPAGARWAEDRVLREIDRLSAIFSGYDPESEFSRWQARPAGPVAVSRELYDMLDASDRWRERTGGAFDPRAEAFSRLWGSAEAKGRVPSPEEIARVKEAMQRPAWRLDPVHRTAERLGDCPLSLNAIAKGLIVGLACESAMDSSHGVRGLALNVGGDLRVCGEYNQGVGIASPSADSESSDPMARVEVQNRAVATSGSSQRGFRIGGAWYSHIVDPRSGMPAGGVASVTVIAENSADADAIATALNVLEPEVGIQLVESLPGIECLIVTSGGATLRSQGWARYESRGNAAEPVALASSVEPGKGDTAAKPESGADAKSWGDEYELVVDFEINQPEVTAEPGPEAAPEPARRGGRGGRGARGRYRRPYVAVWVEDKNGFPVRNLVLWVSQTGAGPFQWIPDLKRWYASDKRRKKVDKKDIVLTIARPTRPPGKYSAIWNGKDDKGRPVPPGVYTISIDAAREHGTYQGLRKEVTIGETPFSESLTGGIEIKSATLSYRRKSESASK